MPNVKIGLHVEAVNWVAPGATSLWKKVIVPTLFLTFK